jgi:hypothetical protein
MAKGNRVVDEAAKKAVLKEYCAGPPLWEGSLLPSGKPHYQPEEAQEASEQGY